MMHKVTNPSHTSTPHSVHAPLPTRRNSAGGVFVEALIAIPLLVALASGIIDYAFALREHAVIVSAARAGARAAAGATFSDGSDYNPGGGQPGGIQPFLCVLAITSARRFLLESGLDPDRFRVDVAPVQLDASLESNGVSDGRSLAAIQVTVGHDPVKPRWFFLPRNVVNLSHSVTFSTESAEEPFCDGVTP
jgi:hypothetical protein